MTNVRIWLAIVLLAALPLCVRAQERPMVKASIPFSFTALNTVLPAGNYTVYLLNPNPVIMLKSDDGRRAAMFDAQPAQQGINYSTQAKLVFRRIGNQYFLTQVWEPGTRIHRELPLGERALEMSAAVRTAPAISIPAD